MRNRNSIPICIIFLLVLVLVFPVQDGNDADVRSLTNIPGLRTGTTHERGPDGLPNSFVEEFTDLKNIDFSNTSCGVDPILGLVSFDSASAVTPSYLGTASMDTRSHGGGFSPKYNEYWYPYWSGSTIYRYNRNYGSTGTFDSGQNEMMQLWGDLDGTYYTANWGQSIITKRTDRGSGTVWVYNIGSTAAAVCCDHRYVYAMVWGDSVIHVLDKENGRLVRQLNLPGWIHSYGGMAAANGKLYIGGYSNYGYSNSNYRGVNIHDAVTGAYEGGFYVDNNIYSMAFNGEEYSISPNSGTIWRYRISDGNAYYGGTADGDDCTRYVQSGVLHSGEVVGAVRLNATHSTPGGCSITYNVTADGRHWETVLPGETHVMVHPGPHLLWNATLVSPDLVDTPTIDRISLEYDLVSNPEPAGPASDIWHGTARPVLEWNFTDPDGDDTQSFYMVEIYNESSMENRIYATDWTGSSESVHQVASDLPDGVYHWRVRTMDSFGAPGNFSDARKIMLDRTAPFGSLVIEGGAETVNERTVMLAITAGDNASGIDSMRIVSDSGSAGPWEEYRVEKSVVLSDHDGPKTLGVRFRDGAGIESRIFKDIIYLDLLGPGTISVSSPTHPDDGLYYNGTKPVFAWEPPSEVAGIKGYSYILDEKMQTQPPRVLGRINGDQVSTSPGEFTVFKDGIWYFHIVSCDIYNQWGNTTHFRINIDSGSPVIDDFFPESAWYWNADFTAGAVVEDMAGSGLDMESIRYSLKLSGEAEFGPWKRDGMETEILKNGGTGKPERARVSVVLSLAEGNGNLIRWRVRDLAGNGPVVSKPWQIMVDLSPVSFTDPVPADGDVFTETDIECGITVTDAGGSGVNGKSIDYSISTSGANDGDFKKWLPAGLSGTRESVSVLLELEFEAGKQYYIRWRAADAVGNPLAYSEPQAIRVNAAPVPAIYSPLPGETFTAGDPVVLDAGGTTDADGDELAFHWRILRKTTKALVFSDSGNRTVAHIDGSGSYEVFLYVDDGNGFNVTRKVEVEVKERPPMEDDDDTPDMGGNESRRGALSGWWRMAAAGTAALLILVIVIVLIARKKQAAREKKIFPETTAPRPAAGIYSPQFGIYSSQPGGYSGRWYPGYGGAGTAHASGTGPYSGGTYPAGSGTGSVGGWGRSGSFGYGGSPYGGGKQSAASRENTPGWHAPVPSPASSYSAQPAAAPPAPAQPALPQYGYPGAGGPAGQPAPADHGAAVPAYVLPSFRTPQGDQDLTVSALPPAAVSSAPPAAVRQQGVSSGEWEYGFQAMGDAASELDTNEDYYTEENHDGTYDTAEYAEEVEGWENPFMVERPMAQAPPIPTAGAAGVPGAVVPAGNELEYLPPLPPPEHPPGPPRAPTTLTIDDIYRTKAVFPSPASQPAPPNPPTFTVFRCGRCGSANPRAVGDCRGAVPCSVCGEVTPLPLSFPGQ